MLPEIDLIKKKEIINFPHCNGYFLVISLTKDWNSHRNRIYIWNDMKIDEELDLDKITFEVKEFLRQLVEEEVSYHAKFFGVNHNILKYFKSENFLSFTFPNNIRCFVMIIANIALIIVRIISKIIEKSEILIIVFYSIIIISILLSVFFHYNKRRLDIFVKDNILFIGITSFTQKSYKKNIYFL